MNDHPNRLQLLNYLNGLDLRDEIKQHINGCAQCEHRVKALEKELAGRPALKNIDARVDAILDGQSPVKPWWHGLVPVFGLVAAMAVALFVFMPAREHNATKLKGGFSVKISVQRDRNWMSVTDTKLKPKDLLMINVVTPETGFLSVYYPEKGALRAIPESQNIEILAGKVRFLGEFQVDCANRHEKMRFYFTKHRIKSISGIKPIKTIDLRCE